VPSQPWGVTAFFDPLGQPVLLANLCVFSRNVRAQGLPLLVVELAFGDRPFQVPDNAADRVLRFRSPTLLWHKERLLNLGMAALPPDCDAVAWLDGDLLFEYDDWVAACCRQLERAPVVQPFDRACWLGPGLRTAPECPDQGIGDDLELPGFAATLQGTDGDRRRWLLATYERHGHTGFAWMARRDVLADGLYDRAILGGGDMIAAHAMAGDQDFLRGRHLYCRWLSRAERAAIGLWGQAMAARTRGHLCVVPGRVLHLFHGPVAGRGYVERLSILRAAEFDPEADLVADRAGCWTWATPKPQLHAKVAGYFQWRVEATSTGAPNE
jgi:hypothetical protein